MRGVRCHREGDDVLEEHIAAFLGHETHVAAITEFEDGGFFGGRAWITLRTIGAAWAKRTFRAGITGRTWITVRAGFALGAFVINAGETAWTFGAFWTFRAFVSLVTFIAFIVGVVSFGAFGTGVTFLARITRLARHTRPGGTWEIAAWNSLVSDWSAEAFVTGWPFGTTAVPAHEKSATSEFAKAGHAIAFQLKAHVRGQP